MILTILSWEAWKFLEDMDKSFPFQIYVMVLSSVDGLLGLVDMSHFVDLLS